MDITTREVLESRGKRVGSAMADVGGILQGFMNHSDRAAVALLHSCRISLIDAIADLEAMIEEFPPLPGDCDYDHAVNGAGDAN